MVKRETLVKIRSATLFLSISSLIVAAVFLMQFMISSLEKKEEIQTPVEVLHKVLFLYSYTPLYYTYDAQISGLKKSLYPKGIEYDIIFLNSN